MIYNPSSSTETCGYPNIDSLIHKAIANEANVTLTVEACPKICTIAWGVGNPDLSGVGVYISYTFELVLVMLFAASTLWILHPPRAPVFAILKALVKSFHDSIAIVVISFFVAAIIRSKKDAPMYELSFAQSLLKMQICCYGSAFIALNSVMLMEPDKEDNDSLLKLLWRKIRFSKASLGDSDIRSQKATPDQASSGARGGRKLTWSSYMTQSPVPGIMVSKLYGRLWRFGFANLFFVTTFILGAIFLIDGNIKTTQEIIIFEELFVACPDQKELAPLLKPEVDVSTKVGLTLGSIMIYSIVVLAPAFLGALPPFYPVVCIVLAGVSKYFAMEMDTQRSELRNLMNKDFTDDEWSFGQFLAVFVWCPTIWQILESMKCILVAIYRRLNRSKAQTDTCSLRSKAMPYPEEYELEVLEKDAEIRRSATV